jgi:molybdopterin-containing oxidoreductase family iron-sulfur binding subunit
MTMLIDLLACTGCNTCTVACKQENNLPEGIYWTQVISLGHNGDELPGGVYPDLHLDYLPLACQHCAESPCIEVCPRAAAYRDEEWGIVMQDPSLCIGCRYCMMVCPYTSVRVYSGENVRFSLPFPTGENPIGHRPKSVEKCTFCIHRLQRGLLPACVESCPVNARTFGDRNDPTSEVSRLLRTRLHFQLLVEKGTEPSVYYLI